MFYKMNEEPYTSMVSKDNIDNMCLSIVIYDIVTLRITSNKEHIDESEPKHYQMVSIQSQSINRYYLVTLKSYLCNEQSNRYISNLLGLLQ